jgi:hypothetical protein
MSLIEQTPVAAKDHEAAADPLVTVVIPCLNEEPNIEACVTSAHDAMRNAGLSGEVVVADNASEDRSAELAKAAGARVVREEHRGYGSAYLAGFAEARGTYIVMGDADLTYDFNEIPNFVEKLEGGADFVIGNRMENIQPGAMPWLHQYVGNPVLSGLLNLFFRTGVRDAHCGLRALRRSKLEVLDLRTSGMEFASEMVISAARCGLVIEQVPIEYHPRGGESKLSTWRDGWRHLRFLLVHAPNYLFLFPGLAMTALGAVVIATSMAQLSIVGREWGMHAEIAGSLLTIIGVQVVSLGLCAHAYGMYYLGDRDPWFDRMRARFRLEHGLALGGLVTLIGLALSAVIIISWVDRGFGALSEERLAILAATLIIVGIQTFFSSFLLSIIGLRRDQN